VIVSPEDLPNLSVLHHPLIRHKLTRMRRKDTDTRDFRRLLNEIAALMTFHACSDMPTEAVRIETPLEEMDGERIQGPITLVPILRAGLGMTEGILSVLSEARVGHIGLYRDEDSLKPVPYYVKLPDTVADGPVLLVDPMVATGNSACHAITELKQAGCSQITLVCLVCAPEGIRCLNQQHPDVPVFTASLDRQLNDKGYILPGLGDAGDRIFGTH
jgi:uracil phosphoribosyltransferase